MKNKAFEYDTARYPNWIDPKEITPYPKNAKLHPPEQVSRIVNSITRFGWQQDVVLDKNGVCVIGHGRRLAALEIGCKVPYHTIDKDRDEITDEDIKALRVADNKVAESDWDFATLEAELAELEMDFDMSEFGFDDIQGGVSDTPTADDKYSHETKIPQYEPSDNPPDVTQLIDTSKLDGMLEEIDGANLTKAEKRFLEIAAYRHAVIDFDKVADYYASARPEMQALMERSALVIIDINDAIANGYVQLSSALDSIMAEDAE
jgi:hypothetical protein